MALNSILNQLQNSKQSKLIFDLDSTLFNLDQRNLSIFNDCAKFYQSEFPEESEKLFKLQRQDLFYDLKKTLNQLQITRNEYIEKVIGFWAERFFSNEYLKFDTPEAGAREFILEAQALGAKVIYLTGRDEPRMLQGTVDSLSQHGFLDLPQKPSLILKPHKDITDHDFKVLAIQPIVEDSKYCCLIDNEPMNLKLTETRFPQMDLVYFESIHTGLAEPELYWKKASNFTDWLPVKSTHSQNDLHLNS